VIRFGGVGLRRGLGLLETLNAHPQAGVVAVCDAALDGQADDHSAVRQLRASGAPIEATYSEFVGLLGHEIDAVLIATPPSTHAAMAVAALDADVHVLCEVPAVYGDLAEADALLSAARRSRARYMMAENCCYWEFIQSWKRMVADGRIGRVTYAEAEYIHDVAELMTDADGGLTWRADLFGLQYCTHSLGPLLDIMDDRVVGVVAMDTGPQRRPEWPAADQAVGLFRTAKGAVIKILCSFSNARRPPHHYYSLYGTKGTLETSRHGPPRTLANFDDEPGRDAPVETPLTYAAPGAQDADQGHGGADAAILHDFVDCLVEDRPPPIDGVRALEFSVPGLAARSSAAMGGRPVDVPDYR